MEIALYHTQGMPEPEEFPHVFCAAGDIWAVFNAESQKN
jgi:hypothetical protein